MRHERDKEVILSSIMGYATHKKISPNKYFKNIAKIKSSKEIVELSERQAKLVDEAAPEHIWTINEQK